MAKILPSLWIATVVLLPFESEGADNFLGNTIASFDLVGVSSDADTECVQVLPGAFYEFGGEVLIAVSDDGTMGRAGVVVRGMKNGECTVENDPNFPNFSLATESAATDWFNLTVGGFLAKPGVIAALVELRASLTNGSGNMSADIRNAFLRLPDHPGEPDCADPALPYDTVTASDALYILKVSVGAGTCVGCQCDTNATGSTSASDALSTLKFAVGQKVAIGCPPC